MQKEIERCFFFVPSYKPIENLRSLPSDTHVTVFDLEDSVPYNKKILARQNLQIVFSESSAFIRAIRINSIRTIDGILDLLLISELTFLPEIIELPMVKHGEEADIVRDMLKLSRKGPNEIWCAVETPICIDRMENIAASFDGMILGSADLAAALNTDMSKNSLLLARMRMVNSAAAYNIPAIDTPCFNMESSEALLEECNEMRELGFYGKCAIHPSQIPVINTVFTPSQNEVALAKELISIYTEQEGKIFQHNGKMIGPPMISKAKNMLKRASVKFGI